MLCYLLRAFSSHCAASGRLEPIGWRSKPSGDADAALNSAGHAHLKSGEAHTHHRLYVSKDLMGGLREVLTVSTILVLASLIVTL